MRIRHVILDRDGVLNREAPDGGHVRDPQAFQWLPGALEALAMLRQAGLRISVATNQASVGRGLMSLDQLEAVHQRMRTEAAASGGELDAVLVCPHAPDAACPCRKPAPGLIDAAVAASGIGAAETLVVGDDRRDLEAAWRAGVNAALVRTGKGAGTAPQLEGLRVPVFDDLPALSRALLAGSVDTAEQTIMKAHRIFAEHVQVISQAAQELAPVIERIVNIAHRCIQQGHKILACGNGGSAADAQHLVAELVGRFRDERRALPAIVLGADPATLTALANDYGYERVFARQIEALAQPGDVLFAISTSGNSPNVLRAVEAAHARGCTVVGLTGAAGGTLASQSDLVLRAPSDIVARTQEVHALCIHAICDTLDALIGRTAP
jgi:phosphoheptose isomerase